MEQRMKAGKPNGLKIISGGQTGVDRAALDAALQLGMDCGGWCPKGRRAEDGPIADVYPLAETESEKYETRTEWNVRDADATLILARGLPLSGGSALTHELALKHGKPVRVIELNSANPDAASRWIRESNARSLNVAGPRESQQPGIYDQSKNFLLHLLNGL